MIIIFTGNGKGKTTAAMGTALRSLSANKVVTIIQFLKLASSGEIKFLSKIIDKLDSKLTIRCFGIKSFINPNAVKESDKKRIDKALNYTQNIISKKPYLLILDEILIALKFGLLKEEILLQIIDDCNNKKIHLILTGRYASKNLINKADLVTEMKKIKHPYDKKIKAIEGIDF